MYPEKQIEGFLYSADKSKLQPEVIHAFLSQRSYWAQNIPMEIVKQAIAGSMCFAVYDGQAQIGFARVITDEATFAYLADVFVEEAYRGRGISKQLMQYIMDYPAMSKIRRFMLATKDAHGLYAGFGFKPLKEPGRFMEIKPFERY
ncbi:MAG: GNAT family N-acetyltransferase [Bacteroidetes bacterium]|nr:GNAT family N-acetyltransferase [Bacteroidota bacterium]